MQRPAVELERRRPVWDALSAVFLDTEIDDAWREEIVATLCASGYSVAELERILWDELCPVLSINLASMVGEWGGFNMQAVEDRILSHPAGKWRRQLSYVTSGRLARPEWERIKAAVKVKCVNR